MSLISEDWGNWRKERAQPLFFVVPEGDRHGAAGEVAQPFAGFVQEYTRKM
jgi:hypothetical protein